MRRAAWPVAALALAAAPWIVTGYGTTLLTQALSFGLLLLLTHPVLD